MVTWEFKQDFELIINAEQGILNVEVVALKYSLEILQNSDIPCSIFDI